MHQVLLPRMRTRGGKAGLVPSRWAGAPRGCVAPGSGPGLRHTPGQYPESPAHQQASSLSGTDPLTQGLRGAGPHLSPSVYLQTAFWGQCGGDFSCPSISPLGKNASQNFFLFFGLVFKDELTTIYQTPFPTT